LEAVTLGCSSSNPTPTSGDSTVCEVTFASTPQFTTNDSRSSLCQVTSVVSGAGAADGTKQLPSVPFCLTNGINVPVKAGERIWIHIQHSQADIGGSGVAYLFIRDRSERSSSRRRN
jgi:hypothetical protein